MSRWTPPSWRAGAAERLRAYQEFHAGWQRNGPAQNTQWLPVDPRTVAPRGSVVEGSPDPWSEKVVIRVAVLGKWTTSRRVDAQETVSLAAWP
jgi:hypothetical protein